jgi:hypothetical protein
VVFLVGIAVPASAVPPGWSAPLRIFRERFGPTHSLGVDSAGNAHVASERMTASGLVYLTDDDPLGDWALIPLTTKEDHSPALAVDPVDDRVWMAFVRSDPDDLAPLGVWTATNATGTFVIRKRFAGFAAEPSIAVRGGTAYIAFRGAGRSLHVLSNESGSWDDQTVVAGGCCSGEPSIALGSNEVYVAWARRKAGGTPGPLRFSVASTQGGAWTTDTIDPHPSRTPSLVTRNGVPFVAYVRTDDTWAATPAQAGWGRVLVAAGFDQAPDLAIKDAGTAKVVVGDASGLRLATTDFGSVSSVELTGVAGDFAPEIGLHGARPRVIFNRASGTTHDGIFFTQRP